VPVLAVARKVAHRILEESHRARGDDATANPGDAG